MTTIQEIEGLLQRGLAEDALNKLKKYNITTATTGRIYWHLTGQCYVYMGQLTQAKECFQRGLDSYGENIALLRDLAAVYYQLSDWTKWRQYLVLFESRFMQHRAQIQRSTLIQCALLLGKFQEELGQVAYAQKYYLDALQASHANLGNQSTRIQIVANIVRLKAAFNDKESLSSHYAELVCHLGGEMAFDLELEVLHALAIAEVRLIGAQFAWRRVRRVLDDQRTMENDQRLVFYDFLEECLFSRQQIPEGANELRNQLQSLSSFELIVDSIAFNSNLDHEHSSLVDSLSFGCLMRVQMLRLLANQTDDQALELKNHVLLLMNSLSSDSRQMWMGRLHPLLHSEDFHLVYDAKRFELRYQGRSLDLSKRKNMGQLIHYLCISKNTNVDQVIGQLWQTSYTPEIYHRLRMTTHRLNHLLFELTAVPKPLELSATEIRLRNGLTLSAIS